MILPIKIPVQWSNLAPVDVEMLTTIIPDFDQDRLVHDIDDAISSEKCISRINELLDLRQDVQNEREGELS